MNILIHVTGTLNSCFLPVALNWMKAQRPTYRIHVDLSESATSFVSPKAVSALTGCAVSIDRWDDPTLLSASPSPHTWLAQHDAVLVYPASLNTLSSIHRLDASTPFLNSVHCTSAPVLLAPNLPPGADDNPAVDTMLNDLRVRRGVTVIDPVSRPSASVERDAHVAPPVWDFVAVLDRCLAEHAGTYDDASTYTEVPA